MFRERERERERELMAWKISHMLSQVLTMLVKIERKLMVPVKNKSYVESSAHNVSQY